MEENLEPIKEVNNGISDDNNTSNSEEVKDTKSEKNINLNANTVESQNNSIPKVDKKNENAKRRTKSYNQQKI